MSGPANQKEATQRAVTREVNEFENDRRARLQAELDHWWQMRLDERAYQRELRARIDPFNYGHWREDW